MKSPKRLHDVINILSSGSWFYLISTFRKAYSSSCYSRMGKMKDILWPWSWKYSVFWVSRTPPEKDGKICSAWLWPGRDTAGRGTLSQRTKAIIFPVRRKNAQKSHTKTQYNYHILAPSTALESEIPAPGKHFKRVCQEQIKYYSQPSSWAGDFETISKFVRDRQ